MCRVAFQTGLSVCLLAGCAGQDASQSDGKARAQRGTSLTSREMEVTAMTISIQSTAFKSGETVPKKYTEDGQNVSPPLSWSGVPERAKELALIVDDPDAPTAEPWVHWVLYKLPPTTTQLPERISPSARVSDPVGALQGKNSWSKTGYGGPAPPKGHGVHHYRFHLYALDSVLQVEAGADKASLLKAMNSHILAEGELVGTYQR